MDFKEQITQLATLQPRVNGLLEALANTAPAVSVRLNRYKNNTPAPLMVADQPLSRLVPWCERGYYLDQRPKFTRDPALHQGRYYVQDASSMFISHVINTLTRDINSPLAYLDACAAPGGKTTAAIDALPCGSLVVANEWDFHRAEILKENLIKWGYPNVVISRGDTHRYRKLHEMFDIISADTPCSGEGMMRKDEEAVNQWSEHLVTECVERQRAIVDNLWHALKPGGYLIYSTCTFNLRENEEIIDYMINELGAQPVTIPTDGFEGIVGAIGADFPAYRFMPHLVEGEGLFMAVVRKPGLSSTQPSRPAKEKNSQKLPITLPVWAPAGLSYMMVGDTLYGVPTQWKAVVDKLIKQLDVIMPGVVTGIVKGKDLIPSQGIAMSTLLDINLVPTVHVDYTTALNYLRRESLTLPDDTPRGHVLVMYDGHPLGWVKHLGNRTNNLYPAQWRILSTHNPITL